MNGPVLLAWGCGGSLGLGIYVWVADGVWGVSAEAGFEGVATVWSMLISSPAIYASDTNLLYVNKALIRAAPNPVVGGSSNE